jgi:amino acid transporter
MDIDQRGSLVRASDDRGDARFLARNNKNHTPIAALITTNLAVQALLLTVLFVRDPLDFMLALDTALSVPYLFAAGYALKLTITKRPTRQPTSRNVCDNRSLTQRPCCTRSSRCTPQALNTS